MSATPPELDIFVLRREDPPMLRFAVDLGHESEAQAVRVVELGDLEGAARVEELIKSDVDVYLTEVAIERQKQQRPSDAIGEQPNRSLSGACPHGFARLGRNVLPQPLQGQVRSSGAATRSATPLRPSEQDLPAPS